MKTLNLGQPVTCSICGEEKTCAWLVVNNQHVCAKHFDFSTLSLFDTTIPKDQEDSDCNDNEENEE